MFSSLSLSWSLFALPINKFGCNLLQITLGYLLSHKSQLSRLFCACSQQQPHYFNTVITFDTLYVGGYTQFSCPFVLSHSVVPRRNCRNSQVWRIMFAIHGLIPPSRSYPIFQHNMPLSPPIPPRTLRSYKSVNNGHNNYETEDQHHNHHQYFHYLKRCRILFQKSRIWRCLLLITDRDPQRSPQDAADGEEVEGKAEEDFILYWN